MLLLLAAGLAKLADWPAFFRSLETWTVLPAWARPPVGVAIPVIEVLIAGLWFGNIGRSHAVKAAGVLLAAFTIAYIAQIATGQPPRCACFGKLAAYHATMSDARWAVARNLGLLAVLSAGTIAGKSTRRKAPEKDPAAGAAMGTSASPGFTLIETLVSIALIGVLLTLFMPTFARVRHVGYRTLSAAQIRQHAAIFGQYASDFRDYFPAITDPRATYSIVRCTSQDVAYRLGYFEAATFWPVALADSYYNGDVWSKVFTEPGLRPEDRFFAYNYSCSFRADPAYYNPSTRRDDSSQWRAVRAGEVISPQAKVLLSEDMRYDFLYTPGRGPEHIYQESDDIGAVLALVDGSVRSVGSFEKGPHMVRGDGLSVQHHSLGHSSTGVVGQHTLDGVRGRDVR